MREREIINTRILLVDDHPMLREGIRRLLEREPDFEIVGEADDGEESVKLAGSLKPEVVIMDIAMPGMSGLEATRQIKAEFPEVAVLVLTIHDEEEYLLGILEAGAAGYLLKSAYGQELVNAVRAVRTGEFVFGPKVGQKLLKRIASQRPKPIILKGVEQLTERETEVLTLAARGMSNKEIARNLNIGVRTVKGHLVNIFGKMEVSSRTEAVLSALRQGLVTFDDST